MRTCLFYAVINLFNNSFQRERFGDASYLLILKPKLFDEVVKADLEDEELSLCNDMYYAINNEKEDVSQYEYSYPSVCKDSYEFEYASYYEDTCAFEPEPRTVLFNDTGFGVYEAQEFAQSYHENNVKAYDTQNALIWAVIIFKRTDDLDRRRIRSLTRQSEREILLSLYQPYQFSLQLSL